MGNSRRKLPSWMLGVKSNENNFDISNNNGSKNEDDNGKLVKACRPAKRVTVKKRKNDGDDDEFEEDLCDEPRKRDEGHRRIKRKVSGDSNHVDNESREGNTKDGNDDEFESESIDEPRGRIGGNMRIKRKVNVDEGDNGSREGKKKDLGMHHQMKDNLVEDEIGYGKRKNSVKVRKEKLGSNLVDDSDDYDYVDSDKEIPGEKRSKRGKKWKGKEKSDESEDDDDGGGGAQAVLRKCKGKRRAVRGKLIHSNDSVDVQGTSPTISDDDDLTVADLVSIAEEYVNKDMEAAQQLSQSQGVSNAGNRMRIRKEHHKENEEICGNNNNQSGGSSNTKLLSREEAGSHDLLNEDVTIMKPIMTGDPAQDMLDLFLGHLLKKPQEEEEEKKLEISLGVERREPVGTPVDAVPFTKKKSSLKDKVAMFFD